MIIPVELQKNKDGYINTSVQFPELLFSLFDNFLTIVISTIRTNSVSKLRFVALWAH